jgi:glutamyl-tRNA reductase
LSHLHPRPFVSGSGLAPLRVRTINHRTCGLPALADLSAGAEGASAVHRELAQHGVHAIALATCNRTEVYWRAGAPHADEAVVSALAAAVRSPRELIASSSITLEGEAVAEHLFRVCSGLESVVLGEAEILGQVRSAMDASAAAGSFLHGVFTAAIRTGRAARAETGIGTGALSVASTAVHWLAECTPLPTLRVMLIGAGATGRKAARHLRSVGVGSLVVVNRTISRAQQLAAPLGAEAVGLDALPRELVRADAVISAVDSPGWVVTFGQLQARMATRPSPLVLIDLSMPPSIEAGACEGLSRVDMTALEATVRQHRQRREDEIPKAEAVIAREIAWLRRWAAREDARPMMSRLWGAADTARPNEGAV